MKNRHFYFTTYLIYLSNFLKCKNDFNLTKKKKHNFRKFFAHLNVISIYLEKIRRSKQNLFIFYFFLFPLNFQHSGTVSEQRQWLVRITDISASTYLEAGSLSARSPSPVSHHVEDCGQCGGFFRPAHTLHIHLQVTIKSFICIS